MSYSGLLAEEGNRKVFFAALTQKRLRELVPNFDPEGVDQLLLSMAQSDLRYYLQVKWNFNEYSHAAFMERFLDYLADEGTRVKVFMDGWLEDWYEQWRTRVEIILPNQPPRRDIRGVIIEDSHQVTWESCQLLLADHQWAIVPLMETAVNAGFKVCLDLIAAIALLRSLRECGFTRKPVIPLQHIRIRVKVIQKAMQYIRQMANLKGSVVRLVVWKGRFK